MATYKRGQRVKLKLCTDETFEIAKKHFLPNTFTKLAGKSCVIVSDYGNGVAIEESCLTIPKSLLQENSTVNGFDNII